MARKSKNSEIVAGNPLIATGVEKMILVIRDKQVLLDRDLATLCSIRLYRTGGSDAVICSKKRIRY